LAFSPRVDLLPRAVSIAGRGTSSVAFLQLAWGQGEAALSPWIMGVNFGVGQLLTAVICTLPWNDPRIDWIERHGPRSKSNAGDDGRFRLRRTESRDARKSAAGILTSLVAHPEGLLFGDLKELCSLTDGNLNRHLAVLEDAHLVATIALPNHGGHRQS